MKRLSEYAFRVKLKPARKIATPWIREGIIHGDSESDLKRQMKHWMRQGFAQVGAIVWGGPR